MMVIGWQIVALCTLTLSWWTVRELVVKRKGEIATLIDRVDAYSAASVVNVKAIEERVAKLANQLQAVDNRTKKPGQP